MCVSLSLLWHEWHGREFSSVYMRSSAILLLLLLLLCKQVPYKDRRSRRRSRCILSVTVPDWLSFFSSIFSPFPPSLFLLIIGQRCCDLLWIVCVYAVPLAVRYLPRRFFPFSSSSSSNCSNRSSYRGTKFNNNSWPSNMSNKCRWVIENDLIFSNVSIDVNDLIKCIRVLLWLLLLLLCVRDRNFWNRRRKQKRRPVSNVKGTKRSAYWLSRIRRSANRAQLLPPKSNKDCRCVQFL